MIVECAVYADGERRPGEVELEDACEASQEPGTYVWIDLEQPTPEEFTALRDEFGLHPLAIEDALEAHQRPKIERYGQAVFIVLRPASYDDVTEDVSLAEVMIFAGDGFAITVRHGNGLDVDAVRRRLEEAPEPLRRGSAGVVHAVLDSVVDDYQPVVDGLQDDITEAERTLFSAEATASTQRIYELGREVLELSRAIQPLVEPMRQLVGGELQGLDPELRSYFRDVLDHVERFDVWVSSQRELLSNLLQANLTQVTIAQNEDMRKISAWVAIAAIPTLIAGIYGMNFSSMPELHWGFGYPLAIGVMAIICVVLYTRFKRAGWL